MATNEKGRSPSKKTNTEWYGGSILNHDKFVPAQEQWRTQWDRVLRWFERVQLIKRKSLKEELDAEEMDIVIAFFQNSYHLRDWLEASKPDLKAVLDELFRKSFEMGACRDICNGFKHKAYANPTHGTDFSLYRECDYFEIMSRKGNSPVKYRVAFVDGSDVRKFDLFALTNTCVSVWKQFLHINNLILAKT